MKKERSGLRIREYLTICFVLITPCWLLLCKFAGAPVESPTWRTMGVLLAWVLVSGIMALLAQDRLEARGRYVDSGIDISRKDVGAWNRRNGYKVSLLLVFWICLWIAMGMAIDTPGWLIAINAGLAAGNAYFAVVSKPDRRG